jgi:hypothetical protein
MSDQPTLYERELLLLGAKRNAVLELWEVERYGSDSYGDGDYVSIYGMRPADWYARGARLLGRTAVECTRDRVARRVRLGVIWGSREERSSEHSASRSRIQSSPSFSVGHANRRRGKFSFGMFQRAQYWCSFSQAAI